MSDLFDTKLDLDLKPDVNPHFKNEIEGLDLEVPISVNINRANKILESERELGSPRNPFSQVNATFLQSVLPVNPDKLSPELKEATADVLAAYIIDGRYPFESMKKQDGRYPFENIGITTETGGVQNDLSNFEPSDLELLKKVNTEVLNGYDFYFGDEIISLAKEKLNDKIDELYELDLKENKTAIDNVVNFSNKIRSIEGIRETFPDLFFDKVEEIYGQAKYRNQADLIEEFFERTYEKAKKLFAYSFEGTEIEFEDKLEDGTIIPSMLTMQARKEQIRKKYSDNIYRNDIPDRTESMYIENELKALQKFTFLEKY
jgi:hypothetical protein